jgi:ribosome-binding protein aMBF1 (putative translation factor)
MRRGCQYDFTPLWGVPPSRRKEDYAILAHLGDSIQTERRKAGLTQERLAELVDLHPRIVQKIEAGELNPKSTTLIRIQSVLKCPWERLMPS